MLKVFGRKFSSNKFRLLIVLVIIGVILITLMWPYRAALAFPTNTTILDNFNRANGSINGSTASSGATWSNTAMFFSQNGLSINTNQATSTAGFGGAWIDSSTYGPDTEVYATLANNGGAASGSEIFILMARITNPTTSSISGYGIEVDAGTSNNLHFWKVDNDTQSFLCTAMTQNPTPAAGDKAGLSVTGTTNPVLEFWYDSGGGWTSKGTCTDTGAAAKYQGAGNLAMEINGTTVRVDDFGGGNVITNQAPAAPTLTAPSNGATGVSITPQFQLRSTDADNDYLRYEIQVCSTSDCSTVVRTICQYTDTSPSCTDSQTGWSGQDQQSNTAYTGNSVITLSTMAIHTYQSPPLSANTQYWWRAYAIDPGGLNTESSASDIWSFTTNAPPAAPTLISPASGATGVAYKPIFQLRTTDAESDYLKYFIQIYSATACGGSQVGSDIDQTASQTNWQGQDQQSATAYTGSNVLGNSSIARYQYNGTDLNPNQTYSWRAKAIDTGGSNAFSSLTSCQDFTTGSSEVRIEGGTEINGGTTIGP